jgi:hypothetical protein
VLVTKRVEMESSGASKATISEGYAGPIARMVKISVSVDKEKLRLAKALAKAEGVSLSALLTRGLQYELDARARLAAALELYGPDGWPTSDERPKIIESWAAPTKRAAKENSRRGKRKAA